MDKNSERNLSNIKLAADSNGNAVKCQSNTVQVSTFRRILPQILASCAKNLLIFDLGLTMAFSTVAVAALTNRNKDVNKDEFLHFDPEQASWLGSLVFIGELIGSVGSGWITDQLGRKLAMLLVNIPIVVAWTTLANATSNDMVMSAVGLLGVSVGLMEAPVITYLGEICEPSIRGPLTTTAGIAATLGMFLMTLMGSFMAWRHVTLVCVAVPIITMVSICFVPETPIWLLSKDRPGDALKALQWLRGWVPIETVQAEFDELKRYSRHSKSCAPCIVQQTTCTHAPPTFEEKIRSIGDRGTRRPLSLMLLLYVIVYFSSLISMRPYIVQIFDSYGTHIASTTATTYLYLLAIFANIFMMAMVRVCGKRQLYLWSLGVGAISCILLGQYGYQYLPDGHRSFHAPPAYGNNISLYPMILMFVFQFCSSVGISSVPPMMLSELFPFKSRAYATGLVAALSYLFGFIGSKTFYNLEVWLSLSVVILLYGVIGLLGFVATYFSLPETEDRSLEDIELYFANKNRKWTDLHIPINSNRQLAANKGDV